jgi:predicted CoA-substrate-specific enzyme activase
MAAASKSLGICIGASSIKAVELIDHGDRLEIARTRVHGHECNARDGLLRVLDEFPPAEYDYLCVTGRKFKDLVNLPSVTEPEASEHALRWLLGGGEGQDAIGGRDARDPSFPRNPSFPPKRESSPGDGAPRYTALASLGAENFIIYQINEDGAIVGVRTGNKCASGTGEFFLQQIGRMDIGLDEAARIAQGAEPYSVSGRCSVFCKSDCTHALNKGIPKERVCAGLGDMIAEKVTEIMGALPRENVLVVGGVTRNAYVMEQLRAKIRGLVVPPEAEVFEALGAALYARHHRRRSPGAVEMVVSGATFTTLPPLRDAERLVTFRDHPRAEARPGDETILGLDVGSTTTKAVLLRTRDDAVLASIYLRTNGNPIRASRACYAEIDRQLGGTPVEIIGLGVTGSGRYIAALHAQTEGVINEIIAHATAAAYFDPEVDTILEIGGQDAKYTYLVNGVPCDYAMNEACSAGTGSFLEEAAKESLGITVRDIQDIALRADAPPNFNDQCAAFISSDIKNASHEVSRENIVAGLVYSICMNYSNRVKGARKVGRKVFMQGGVCYNRAVPLAMAALLDKPIVVPPEPGLMGAFGVALELKQRMAAGQVERGSFDLRALAAREVRYGRSFTCPGTAENCDRGCVINVIELDGKKYPFGGICNKYYNVGHHRAAIDPRPLDYVARRQEALFGDEGSGVRAQGSGVTGQGLGDGDGDGDGGRGARDEGRGDARLPSPASGRGAGGEGGLHDERASADRLPLPDALTRRLRRHPLPQAGEGKPTIGIPRSLMVNLLYPLYEHFFTEMGFPIVLSDGIDPEGVQRINAAFCYPVQLAHGMMMNLMRKQPDYILLPQISQLCVERSAAQGKNLQSTCVAVQAEPHYLCSAFKDCPSTILVPQFDFQEGWEAGERPMVDMAVERLGCDRRRAVEAYRGAVGKLQAFFERRRQLGREFLAELERDPARVGVVLFGRAYNAFASEANMGIPRKFASRGVPIVPFDCLPFHDEPSQEHMNWATGQDLIRAARFVKKHPQLFAAFITNFSCGPDSFVVGYVRDIMKTKPSLTLEIDNHTADAGVTTRVEAFLDIVDRYRRLGIADPEEPPFRRAEIAMRNGRSEYVSSQGTRHSLKDPRVKVLFPSMGRTLCEAAAATFEGFGIRAEPVPPPTFKTLMTGRANASCKECLPLILTTGSLVEYLDTRRADGELLLYFMPTTNGNCRFPQYYVFLNKLIEKRRVENVATLTLSTENNYGGLGAGNIIRVLKGVVVADVMDDVRNAIMALARDPHEGLAEFDRQWGRVLDCLRGGLRNFYGTLDRVAADLARIPLRQPLHEARRVLMAGEIYVRKDEFSSGKVVEALARRGIVVQRAPLLEWIRYIDYWAQKVERRKLSLADFLEVKLRMIVQNRVERKVKQSLARSGLYEQEIINVEEVLRLGEHFVPRRFGGETILVVGRFFQDVPKHFDGMVSIGPFACLPTRIIESILAPESKVQGNRRLEALPVYGQIQPFTNLPFLSVESDGNPFPQIIEAQIEAFCLQVDRLHRRRLGTPGAAVGHGPHRARTAAARRFE